MGFLVLLLCSLVYALPPPEPTLLQRVGLRPPPVPERTFWQKVGFAKTPEPEKNMLQNMGFQQVHEPKPTWLQRIGVRPKGWLWFLAKKDTPKSKEMSPVTKDVLVFGGVSLVSQIPSLLIQALQKPPPGNNGTEIHFIPISDDQLNAQLDAATPAGLKEELKKSENQKHGSDSESESSKPSNAKPAQPASAEPGASTASPASTGSTASTANTGPFNANGVLTVGLVAPAVSQNPGLKIPVISGTAQTPAV